MEEKKFPFAFIIIVITLAVMIGLTVWQFTLPKTNPLIVMVILVIGGFISCGIWADYAIKNSSRPFSAGATPLGVMLYWSAFSIFSCGIWYSLLKEDLLAGIVVVIVSLILAIMGYFMIK